MPEGMGSDDLGVLWRSQPEETAGVEREPSLRRWTRELYFTTRAEILASIGAAVFFFAVVAWRIEPAHGRSFEIGFAAGIAWVLISLFRFRSRIWRGGRARRDELALPGLEYYRKALERRRDHLRNEWIWHGPLFLACLILLAAVAGKTFPGMARVETTAPLFVLLAGWTAYGIRQRRRQANQLQREIDELDRERR
jgi:hypothetical protein